MENPFGGGLAGFANIVMNKWYAAVGLAGMILFLTSLLFPIPTDPVVAGCIGLMMMGWGFGQTDCRTSREKIRHGYKITGPAWRLTVSGALMFVIAIGAAIRLAVYLI
ncbi:hypothetical protein [Mameliella alba]|uniref:Uncharacterized protein n=1 Tax=Mameliella alba TaxID=561184 RepID=A0A0B3S169_9RHOB|nr:hypothetical protein [Mameliella alba]KHQ50361.1 hypothetical protein OA50_05036 [Mameliella alba]